MGRLTKVTIASIVRLRKRGHTQKEVATKLGIHVRTVRNYDPARQPERRGQPKSIEGRVRVLEEAVRVCWDWIHLIHCAMLRQDKYENLLEKETFSCPRCNGHLNFDGDKCAYLCGDCGHKLCDPLFWCYDCLSYNGIDYVEATDNWVCHECNRQRYVGEL